MTSSAPLLDTIRNSPDTARLLAAFEFDIERKSSGAGLRLASGAPLEPIAGDFTGGAYFLCAEEDGGGRRPVVFASSEGQGGLIADDLASALEIIVGLEWRACLGYSGGGDVEVMQASARHLERRRARDEPDITEDRVRIAAALSLRVPPVADLVTHLHQAAARSEPDYVVATEDGETYGPLFGEYTEPRLGGWD
ncbi:hypothetical protein [Streptomyces rimosus]|uniref:hypothetical protein n=1 Tax=Streptomyces rimosus TaxID=1927 RepID=UPI0004C7AECC|nr:hypothetical protein [Streptomyces rimosus]